MPRLKTTEVRISDPNDRDNFLRFKYVVNVNAEGHFTATIPPEISEILKNANVTLVKNRAGNLGFFEGSTLAELQNDIQKTVLTYFSRQLVEEKLVIKYHIATSISYQVLDGSEPFKDRIVPDGYWKTSKGQESNWKSGTENTHAASPGTYGLSFYAKILNRKTYLYDTGKEKVEYTGVSKDAYDVKRNPKLHNLAYICGFRSQEPGRNHLSEVPYSDEMAEIFIDMYKFIVMMNEKIVGFVDPEALLKLVESKQKLLS